MFLTKMVCIIIFYLTAPGAGKWYRFSTITDLNKTFVGQFPRIDHVMLKFDDVAAAILGNRPTTYKLKSRIMTKLRNSVQSNGKRCKMRIHTFDSARYFDFRKFEKLRIWQKLNV